MELCLFATVALFLLFSMFPRYPADRWLLIRRLKKVIASFFIGVLIFLVSSNKSNDLLIYSCPLAIMAINHIEIPQIKLKQEMVDCSNSLLRVCFFLTIII
jgi:hypothetical protein